MRSPYQTLGLPTDSAALCALAAAVVTLVLAVSPLWKRVALPRTRTLLVSLAAVAALLSGLYIGHYLRGGPRIVDATSYYLEGKAMARGLLSFEVPLPSAAFRGRFLVTPTDDGTRLSVIFPPGYPALLALGFWLGAPLMTGPLLAALLVLATYFLSHELLGRPEVARLAAVLSTLCAALRYHTADTMSHGLSALLFALSLGTAARGGRSLWLSGLALGWLCATRPVTGAVALLLCGAVALRHRLRALTLLPGLVPGLALLALHQHAATGSFFGSPQLRYYALADHPPGCFRWGFGAGIGCLFEHGDFVKARLPEGYGPLEALLNTLRRLWPHSIDVANFVPFALLVPYSVVRFVKRPGVLALGAGALGIMLAYAGFYFDGSYPGGGARFFADALPLEHALLALALCELGAARFAAPCMLLGFALHSVHGHRALAAREGGRPMFEPAVLRAQSVTRGLVLVGTDQGFALGHDPAVKDPWHGVMVARERDDAHDALLWERFGRPPAYRYSFHPAQADTTPLLLPFEPEIESSLRYEMEAEWPPLIVTGGSAYPDFNASPCVSRGRGLRLERTGAEPATMSIEVTPRAAGPHEIWLQWLADPPASLRIELEREPVERAARGSNLVARELAAAGNGPCFAQAIGPAELRIPSHLKLESAAKSVLVDYIELRPAASKMR